MKKTARNSLLLLTALFAVFIGGFMIGRHNATSVPLADVSELIPTKPFEPEMLPQQEVIGGKININTASKETLLLLPGIGINTAQLIIEYRNENGPFTHIEQLRLIDDMGEKRFNDIAKYITVGE